MTTYLQKKSLQGLNILITRPAEQSHQLFEEIQKQGCHPFLYPTLDIIDPENPTDLIDKIKRFNQFHLCIFLSQNAVLKSATLIKKIWPTLPKNLKLAAIGAATTKALQQYHFPVHLCPDTNFSSEGLLALPALKNLHEQKILLIQGAGGRGYLAPQLIERGASVEIAIAYQRICPKPKPLPLPLEKIDIIISTSGESLQNLNSLLATQKTVLHTRSLIVISERLANIARELGFNRRILVAKKASDLAIIDCLISKECQ
jgi:uroporphyrinogen-III synthase